MTVRSNNLTKPEKVAPVDCIRCGGRGIYGTYGVCFRCGGGGQDPTHRDWAFPADWSDDQVAEFHAEREARNARARERRQERKIAKKVKVRQLNLDRYPNLVPIHERYTTRYHEGNEEDQTFFAGFAGDILSKLDTFELTEKQVQAVIASVAEEDEYRAAQAERLANTPPVTESTQEITATIVSQKWQENQWGGQLKMLVELDNGQRLWGTKPAALEDADVDDRVTFTANVTPSPDDHTFGFFSRPRKASRVEPE